MGDAADDAYAEVERQEREVWSGERCGVCGYMFFDEEGNGQCPHAASSPFANGTGACTTPTLSGKEPTVTAETHVEYPWLVLRRGRKGGAFIIGEARTRDGAIEIANERLQDPATSGESFEVYERAGFVKPRVIEGAFEPAKHRVVSARESALDSHS